MVRQCPHRSEQGRRNPRTGDQIGDKRPRMKASPLAILMAALIAAAAFVAPRHGIAAAPDDWSNARRVEIRMIEYEIVPSELRLRRGLPYRLHLVNAGKEGHDFTAADFF